MKAPGAKKDPPNAGFDLEEFLPYLLNQAAEATSRSFQSIYTRKYGMTRTQWRVLANLGRFGSMTASDICKRSHVEKTKVSRAIAALEQVGLLRRETSISDRRAEALHLTASGLKVFRDLGSSALEYDCDLRRRLGSIESDRLVAALKALIRIRTP
jgi:DNA-binding MarR family transcriptional regulator